MLGRSGLSWQGCVGRYGQGGTGHFCEYYLGSTMETRREGWQLWRIQRWRGEWEAAATMPRIFLFFSPLPSQQQFVVWSLAATADTDRTQMPKINHRMVNHQSIHNYKSIVSMYEQSGCSVVPAVCWDATLKCGDDLMRTIINMFPPSSPGPGDTLELTNSDIDTFG